MQHLNAPKWARLLLVVIIGLAFIGCLFGVGSFVAPKLRPRPTNTEALFLNLSKPTGQEIVLDATQSPTGAMTVSVVPAIPGLTHANLKAYLEKHGMSCGPVEAVYGVFTQDCSQHTATGGADVTFWSHSLETVEAIYASIDVDPQSSNSINSVAIDFLGFVGTVVFPDSPVNQEAAQAWITTAVPKATGKAGTLQKTKIEDIPFMLGGARTGRMLTVGNNPLFEKP